MTSAGSGPSHRHLWRRTALALIVLAALGGCSSIGGQTPSLTVGPDRPLLGTCSALDTMQECADRLTNIYLETEDAFDRVSTPSPEQEEALEQMVRAGEEYSSKCRRLNVRAGAEVNMRNGCDEALADIVEAYELMS